MFNFLKRNETAEQMKERIKREIKNDLRRALVFTWFNRVF